MYNYVNTEKHRHCFYDILFRTINLNNEYLSIIDKKRTLLQEPYPKFMDIQQAIKDAKRMKKKVIERNEWVRKEFEYLKCMDFDFKAFGHKRDISKWKSTKEMIDYEHSRNEESVKRGLHWLKMAS